MPDANTKTIRQNNVCFIDQHLNFKDSEMDSINERLSTIPLVWPRVLFLRLSTAMPRLFLYLMLIAFFLPSCTKPSRTTIPVVKPKYHPRWYDRTKDRHTSRIKKVRVKN